MRTRRDQQAPAVCSTTRGVASQAWRVGPITVVGGSPVNLAYRRTRPMAPLANVPPPVNVHALHAHISAWKGYTVREGDTLSAIAHAYKTSVPVLAARNNITNPNAIGAGTTLQVPDVTPRTTLSKGATSTGAAKARSATARTAAKVPARTMAPYTVKQGDTLSSIALANGTTVAALAKANNLADPDLIILGRTLQVPTKAAGISTPISTSAAAGTSRSTSSTAPSTTTPTTRSSSGSSTSLTIADRTFLGRTYSESTVKRAAETRAYLATRPVPTRSQTKAMIIATANRYGVDPRLALAIGWQESGWNQRAVSVAGAIGVMQVMPSSGQWAEGLGGTKINLLDPQDNITAGILIIRYNVSHASSLDQAIAAYYQGLGGVRSNGMYPDTKAYVKSVRNLMNTVS